MVEYRELGQEARQEFTHLVSDFQKLFPHLKQDRTSQWMNQAQILRPHFWAYLQGEGEIADPMFSLRLLWRYEGLWCVPGSKFYRTQEG